MRLRSSLWVVLAILPSIAYARKPDVETIAAACRAGKQKDCAKLVQIARTSADYDVRMAAIAKVTDQSVLASMATTDGFDKAREAALANLIDQAVIAQVAKTDKSITVRKAAVLKLEDQAVLADLVRGGNFGDRVELVWLEPALERLTDPKALLDIVENHKHTTPRTAALKKVADQGALARIGKTLPDDLGFAYHAPNIIAERLTDQALLSDLAWNAQSPRMKEAARRALTDETMVAALLKADGEYSYVSTEQEIGKIKDGALLADLVRSAKVPQMREAAVAHLRDTALLTKISTQNKDLQVRRAAAARLTALKQNVVVAGSIFEPTLGKPLAAFALDIGSGKKSYAETVTNAEGAFSMDGGIPPGRSYLRHKGSMMSGPRGFLDVNIPATGRVELGRIEMYVDEAVTAAYGGACEGTLREGPPGSKLLVFQANGKTWAHSYATRGSISWEPPWPAALCIHETTDRVGEYRTTGSALYSGAAYSKTWRARVIRLPDGKSFETQVTGAPPETRMDGHSSTGNPAPKLVEWLKTLQ